MCGNANLSVGRDDLEADHLPDALNEKTCCSDVIVEQEGYQGRPVTVRRVQVWTTAGTKVWKKWIHKHKMQRTPLKLEAVVLYAIWLYINLVYRRTSERKN